MTQEAVAISDIVGHAREARLVTDKNVQDIQQVNANLRMLAFNALIESQRVGEVGAGFGVVADEVKSISTHVEALSKTLSVELGGQIEALERLSRLMAEQASANRYTDLALNAVELIDRNLFERTCDVRWWATDSAVVDALMNSGDTNASEFASQRLAVILGAYTVYLDLWLCDMNGNVIANGRPDRFRVQGANVAKRPWFAKARSLASGDDYSVDDVCSEPLLDGAQTASYAASVREGGLVDGRPIGVLGIHFDWKPQAEAIVRGVRLTEEERHNTRVLLTDARGLVIAASDGRGVLSDKVELRTQGQMSGAYADNEGRFIAFHQTPGYETYQGLGWNGVIIQG